MNISIIIPTNRDIDKYTNLLNSFPQQIFSGQYEVILIINTETDISRQVLNILENLPYKYKCIWEPMPGLHNARNRAIFESSFDILTFIDDDVRLTPNWLEGIAESFLDPKISIAGGNILPEYEITPPEWLSRMWDESKCLFGYYLYYLSILDFGDHTIEIPPEYIFGCNFSIRKNVLIEAGGFNPDAMPSHQIKFRGDGETAVSNYIKKRGDKAIFNPKASLYHCISKNRMTIEYFIKRAFMEGITRSFTDCRQQYKEINNNTLKRIPIENKRSNNIQNLCKRFSHFIKKWTTDYKYNRILRNLHKSFMAGYRFHQKEFNSNAKIKDWVLQKDFFNSVAPPEGN